MKTSVDLTVVDNNYGMAFIKPDTLFLKLKGKARHLEYVVAVKLPVWTETDCDFVRALGEGMGKKVRVTFEVLP